ncbi:Asp-tRNA(Asn)/Glu-tRNA(Gln) amidotransferase subunit GatA [Candidatus Uhrbacteria bacterium]|nr:Asp-tRNA(Asn)/Glu-tRNA(Gln) amidotransferase subunit GatA [Candidatus Uhrbacteria bacterium]
MDYLTITDIADGLRRRLFSAEEVTRGHLSRIAERDADLGCYLHVMADDALATAKRVDAAIARGEDLEPLAGVPLAVKDVILVAGHPATAGSKMLERYQATYDATAVVKLKAQDAVLLGKTNCDEFAMGSSNENSAYKPVRNPWDHGRVPGGSSGGSAAAVAADLCVAALGSDTGGSIRQPAGFCGVVGLKPTYGSVSRSGLIAMASSFDVIGPFARTVADARTMFEAIRGRDPRDATSSDRSTLNSQLSTLNSLKVGIPKEYFASGIDPDVERAVREAIRVIEGLGCSVREVSLPHTTYGLAVYYVLMPSEVSANLARFDGMRYGASLAREEPNAPLQRAYHETRAHGFGPEPRRRIMLGTYALSKGYADQYYKRALAVRQRIKHDFETAFREVDVLVTPTSPTPAWPFGAMGDDPLSMYLADVFTVSANVAGIPGLSLPCGLVERETISPPRSEGEREGVQSLTPRLPVGLQLMGRWFDEESLFTLGEAYEQATTWHKEHPPR